MAQTHTVLVVDDERDITLLVADHLGSEGYTVRVAHSAEEAIASIEAEPPDLVVSDICMPGKSGMEVLAHATHVDSILPVIFLSAKGDAATAKEALRQKAEDFLDKPLDFDRLSLAVERALERRELRLMERRYQAELELTVDKQTQSLRRALSEVQVVFNSTVEAMVSAIEARDSETQFHCRRAREYTLMLAHRLRVRGKPLQDIGWGSLLHDVGKIGVPDHILLKEGRLTREEWDEVKKHPLIGFRILHTIPFLKDAAQIVLHHHERYDGTGYPFGKRGEEIPLGARIFSVADAFETITSRRPYKDARPLQDAVDEILRCSGSQFDPQVVAAFREVPRAHWLTVRKKFRPDDRIVEPEPNLIA